MEVGDLSEFLRQEWLSDKAAHRFVNLVNGPFSLEDAVFQFLTTLQFDEAKRKIF